MILPVLVIKVDPLVENVLNVNRFVHWLELAALDAADSTVPAKVNVLLGMPNKWSAAPTFWLVVAAPRLTDVPLALVVKFSVQ